MSVAEVAEKVVSLYRNGQFDEAVAQFYAEDVVSVGPTGPRGEMRGLGAVYGKARWWKDNHQVHGVTIDGPFVSGDRFIVRLRLDVTHKADGERRLRDEIGVSQFGRARSFRNGTSSTSLLIDKASLPCACSGSFCSR